MITTKEYPVLLMTPNEIALMALRRSGKFHDVAYIQMVEDAINRLLEEKEKEIIEFAEWIEANGYFRHRLSDDNFMKWTEGKHIFYTIQELYVIYKQSKG